MEQKFIWRKLGPQEKAKEGDYWARKGAFIDYWVNPKSGMKKGSHYIGNTVEANRVINGIHAYDLWRCLTVEGPRRLPMNPIFSKPLPLP